MILVHHGMIKGIAGRLRRRLRAVSVLVGVTVLATSTVMAQPANAYEGSGNNYACYPLSVPSYYQGEINNLITATLNLCAAVPRGTYRQTSGWTTVGGGSAWFYMQQNANGYTQLQLSGPGYWWAYWQQNPPEASHQGCSWYQEQVNTWKGGPSYFTTGWVC